MEDKNLHESRVHRLVQAGALLCKVNPEYESRRILAANARKSTTLMKSAQMTKE
jgi:hypothetical protein